MTYKQTVSFPYWLWLECLLVFAGIPLLYWTGLLSASWMSVPLIVVTVPAVLWLGRREGFSRQTFWVTDVVAERALLSLVLWRFALTASLLLAIAWWWIPEHWLDLPRQQPVLWLAFIVAYPLLSVYPQELLYRSFFYRRYAALIADRRVLVLLNALLFSWVHIVFNSVLALVYTFIGALYFSHTYLKGRSLRLVCLEHALYGSLLISIGHARDFLTSDALQYFKL